MKLFDTHAHLNDPQLIDRETEVIQAADAAGVTQIVAIGTDLKSSLQCVQIAERRPSVYAAVGIHPNSCHLATRGQWIEIKSLLDHSKVVAIGETGLDCYWDDCPLQTQQTWFAMHIELSHATGKPLVIHMRDSEHEILAALNDHQKEGRINGIMHSFTGTWETAQKCLEYGMYISFAGMVTFKNAASLREIAKRVPLDRILVETDSPYLTPHPHRGKRPNQPEMVAHTASCLADVCGIEIEEFAKLTTDNANRVFQIRDANNSSAHQPSS